MVNKSGQVRLTKEVLAELGKLKAYKHESYPSVVARLLARDKEHARALKKMELEAMKKIKARRLS